MFKQEKTGKTEEHAGGAGRGGYAGRTAATAIACVALVAALALLVLPGFLAAGLSWGKTSAVQFTQGPPPGSPGPGIQVWSGSPTAIFNGFYRGRGGVICDGSFAPVLKIIFTPAQRAMQASPALLDFYYWQYDMAGGRISTGRFLP